MFFELYRQRQQLADELNERTETLRLNEMFSAVLAHDLRSPLSAILASARLLQRRIARPGRVEAAARIVASGKRMARMIEDMLDLARARLGGGIIVKREPADFGAWSSESLREHQAAAPERSIEAATTAIRRLLGSGAHRPSGIQSDRQCPQARQPRAVDVRLDGTSAITSRWR